jgi:hypothetical protein
LYELSREILPHFAPMTEVRQRRHVVFLLLLCWTGWVVVTTAFISPIIPIGRLSSSSLSFGEEQSTGGRDVMSLSARATRMLVVHRAATAGLAESAPEDDENEPVEPGKMRVSEIKSELQLREVDYSDCFDKESLVERLNQARATGRASPTILDKFNRQKIEETFNEKKAPIDDINQIKAAVANDGTLPGGLTPEQFQKLSSNPEIMALLQNTKMQEAMKLMMTGGREELEKQLQQDQELAKTVAKLNEILTSL